MTFPKDKKVCLISLGCDKNTVDAEHLTYLLKKDGFQITSDANEANVIIVNTCAFIKPAQEESIETILRVEQLKKFNLEKLIVTGCLSQRNGKELEKEIPLVDRFLPLNENEHIAEIIFDLYGKKYVKDNICTNLERLVSTPPHYAYVKIAEGCNNFCSYCTIPFIRGRYRSFPLEKVVNECKLLVENGATELILVAQDVTRYGTDLNSKTNIVKLIKEITKIPKLKWLRLHYCYPELITDELIEEIDANPKVCKYIDIPLQHVDDNILIKMNRKDNYKKICQIIEKIKKSKNPISIRSSFIVGFPYETQNSQNLLIEFLRKYKLDNVGFFVYSREEGTASYNFPQQVPQKLKKERQKELYKIQSEIAFENNQSKIGQYIEAVCEEYNETKKIYIFRSQYNSPNVDTLIFVKSKEKLELGKYYTLKIIDFKGYDLIAKVEGEKI